MENNDMGLRATNAPYINPTPGRIPILAKSLLSYGFRPKKDDYETLSYAGFTMGTESYGALDTIQRALNAAQDTDVKFAIGSADLRKDEAACKNVVDHFKNDQNLAMWMLSDEPKVYELEHVAQMKKVIEANDKNHMAYINLNAEPGTSPEEIKFIEDHSEFDWEGNYEKYLEIIQNLFAPAVWSYDFYPFSIKNGIMVQNEYFYKYLELFSQQAKKTNRPFWAYCLSAYFKAYSVTNGIRDKVSHESAKPTLESIKFEVFSALAYGAQGIVYWTYGLRKSEPLIEYIEAPLDSENNPTEIWNYVKKVNTLINRYSKVFYNSKLMSVRHIGHHQIGTTPLSFPFGPLSGMTISGKGALVSHLMTNNKNYLVIVSHDIENKQNYTLTFNTSKYNIIEITPQDLVIGPDNGQRTLDKGSFMIFEWKLK